MALGAYTGGIFGAGISDVFMGAGMGGMAGGTFGGLFD